MDTNMEDVGRAPEPSRLSPATEPASIPTLDGWIESLMTCKQLAEVDVQRLCEKVCVFRRSQGSRRNPRDATWFKSDSDSALSRHERFCRTSQTFSLW